MGVIHHLVWDDDDDDHDDDDDDDDGVKLTICFRLAWNHQPCASLCFKLKDPESGVLTPSIHHGFSGVLKNEWGRG